MDTRKLVRENSAVGGVVGGAAFPEGAEGALVRLLEDHPEVWDDIAEGGIFCRAVVGLSDVSRSFTEAVRRDPTLLESLRAAGVLERELTSEDLLEGLDEELKQNPETDIRHWKRSQMLRIMVRDIEGGADLLSVTREVSALADACLIHCFEQARQVHPDVRMAIIGMGKLGGNELNYSSDVDVVFVHAPADDGGSDAARAAAQIARQVMAEMSATTASGLLFPVDADLRPEGPAGALSRTPEAHRNYFAKWAHPWERQAWMKARYVVGDLETANELLNAAREFVWRPDLDPKEIRYIRDLKTKVEESVAKSQGRDFKRGPGGIRDIEFSTQLLVLVRGRTDPMVRSPNTLLALEQLKRAGSVDAYDANHLSIAYRYLRTVEHRMQLRDERAVYEIPADEEGRNWLARVLGHRDGDGRTAVEVFEEQHARFLASVRSIQQKLFLRPTLEEFVTHSHEAWLNPAEQLKTLGFKDPEQGARIVETQMTGTSAAARTLSQVLPGFLSALAETPDPDIGLIRFDWITDGPHRVNAIVPSLRDSPEAVKRLSILLGSSKVAAGDLRREPDFVSELAQGDLSRSQEQLRAGLEAAIDPVREDQDPRRNALRRFVRRERLRILSRHLLGIASTPQVGCELAELAEVASEAALEVLQDVMGGDNPPRMCIIGLGSFGGSEMLYTSDLDAIILYAPQDGREAADSSGSTGSSGKSPAQIAERIAKFWVGDISQPTAEGYAWEVDLRLRPEGAGLSVHTVDAYSRYWADRARLWEFQALLKARVVAGDAEMGREFMETAADFVYAKRDPRDTAEQLWQMRQRIFEERALGKADIKRGPGGQLDTAFAVQLLQLIHGCDAPSIRQPNTLAAIDALADEGILDTSEAQALGDGYAWCSTFAAKQYLISGSAEHIGVFPEDEENLQLLSRVMASSSMSDSYMDGTSAPEPDLETEAKSITATTLEAINSIFARHHAA